MEEKEKILERIRERFEFIDLHDWGSFYTKQIYPLLKEEDNDKWGNISVIIRQGQVLASNL